ncbi:MAG: hypothetical protein RBR24_06800 [Candidatus Carbobacillus sp.]|nr:hypothetical protein [Candidatus Carbobacillus sp.]
MTVNRISAQVNQSRLNEKSNDLKGFDLKGGIRMDDFRKSDEMIDFKTFVQRKLQHGGGSYLFLMIFQDYCQRAKIKDLMTYQEWEELLEDFGNRPTKDVFEQWF